MSDFTHPRQPVTRAVLEAAAASVGIAVGTMLSGSREAHIMKARRIAARTFRQEPHCWSLPRIGRALGGVHHTTVLNLLRTEPRKKRRSRTSPDVVAGAEADILHRIGEIAAQRAGLQGEIAALDAVDERLRRALSLLKPDCEE